MLNNNKLGLDKYCCNRSKKNKIKELNKKKMSAINK